VLAAEGEWWIAIPDALFGLGVGWVAAASVRADRQPAAAALTAPAATPAEPVRRRRSLLRAGSARARRRKGSGGASEGRGPTLDVEADDAHERERIAAGDHAGAQAVIETDVLVLNLVFEMDVAQARVALGHMGEGEVMGGDEAERGRGEQRLDQALRS